MCSDSDTVGRQHEGGARRTSTREEDEQGAPFLMRLYMLVNLSRSSWIQRLLSLGRYLIRRPRSGSARLSRSRRHAPVRHRQTTATTPASSCPLYSLSHPALRHGKTTMDAGARGVVRGGPAAYIRVSLSELENKHLGGGHWIVHDVLQEPALRGDRRRGQPSPSTKQPPSFSTPASGKRVLVDCRTCSPGRRSRVEAPYQSTWRHCNTEQAPPRSPRRASRRAAGGLCAASRRPVRGFQ